METDAVERRYGGTAVEHDDHHSIALRCRKRRDAQVHGGTVDRDARPAVLRSKPVGDVEPRENLDARYEGRTERPGKRAYDSEHAVDAVAHGDSLLFRFDVNVARATRDACGEELVDERTHGRRGVAARNWRRGI